MESKITFLKNNASIFCILILFSFKTILHAQIIYTDIPDATPSATYPLDLNNDAQVDFLIQFDLSNKIMCKPQNSNAYAGNLVAGVYLPWALNASASICSSLSTWYDSNNYGTMAWGSSTGYWVGVNDKYLALKLVVGNNTYFGWARLDVIPGSTSFTIKDYAYESSPNTCIQAGQTITGMHEYFNSPVFSVFPNPAASSFTIQFNRELHYASLSLYNASGQLLRQVQGISGQSVSVSREDLPNGLYLIRLSERNQTIAVQNIVFRD